MTFLDEVAQKIIDSKKPIGELTIVLPSKRSGVFFKKSLKDQLTTPLLAPKIFSIEEFIQEISTLTLAPPTSTLMDFYSVYKENTPLEFLETFEEFIQWASSLLKDFSDLDAYLVDVPYAFKYLCSYHELGNISKEQSSHLKQKNFWNSLPIYFNELRKVLLQKEMGTLGMLYREAVDTSEIYLQNTTTFHYFIGFNALNASESRIIQSFLEVERADIIWDIDEYFYKDEQHSMGHFIQKYHRNWTYLKKGKKPKFPEHFTQSKKINIVGISKNFGQAKYAASLIKSSNINTKTALVLGNESLLIPVLSGLSPEIEQWNITMGYPVNNTPVASFFKQWFGMHERATTKGFLYDDIVQVLSFDWIRTSLNIKTLDLIKLGKLNKSFITKKDLLFLLKNTTATLLFSPFVSTKEFITRISDFIFKISEQLYSQNGTAYAMFPNYFTLFQELTQQLLNMGEDLQAINNIKGIYYLWTELTNNLTVNYTGNPIEGVQIMGMLETRVLDFDNIIITNVNEGTFPSSRGSKSIFPFSIKKELGLPTFLDNDLIYSYHFYRLLQRASTITLLYNTESDELNSSEPSRFIHQLRFLGLKEHQVSEHYVSAPTKNQNVNQIKVYKTPNVIKALEELAFKGFSPSSLSLYLRDPLQFYKQKILMINEENTFSNALSPLDSGTILHDSLEELYTPFIYKSLKVEDYTVLKNNVPTVLLKHYRKVFGGDESIIGRNLLIIKELEQLIYRFLEIEKKKIIEGNTLTIIKLEEEFKYTINVNGVGSVTLNGKIDRIDRYNGVFRIIDYKSGKIEPSNVKIINWNVFQVGIDVERLPLFQILLYAYVNNKILDTENIINAGIISFKNLNPYVLYFSQKQEDTKIESANIDKNILSSFETVLIGLIQEIFDTSKPFTTNKHE